MNFFPGPGAVRQRLCDAAYRRRLRPSPHGSAEPPLRGTKLTAGVRAEHLVVDARIAFIAQADVVERLGNGRWSM